MRSIILVILFSTAQLFGATGELPTSVGTPLEAANDTQLTTELGNATAGQHILLTGSSYSTHRTLADGIMIIGDPASAPDINGVYTLSGDDSWVWGLDFDHNTGSVIVSGDRANVQRCYFSNATNRSPVRVQDGDDVVIAYNEIDNWGSTGTCGAYQGITVTTPSLGSTDGAIRIEVAYNYLHDQVGYNPESCSNDAEFIQIGQTGTGGRAQSNAGAYVHHNYVVNCLGDNEGMGVKSSNGAFEYNHFDNVRGFNNRFGNDNTFTGNRMENVLGGGRTNRGGLRNLSLGEVTDGPMQAEGGTMEGDDTWPGGTQYFRSDTTKFIGTEATGGIHVGVTTSATWTLNALDTLVQDTSSTVTTGTMETNTTDDSAGAPSQSVPTAITLTTADVGPLADNESSSGSVSLTGETNFGYAIKSSETVDSTITISNNSGVAVSGSITGVSAPFSIISGGTITSLADGASQELVLRFTPTTAAQSNQTITADITAGTDSTLDITGVGVTLLVGLGPHDADVGVIVSPLVDQGDYINQPAYTHLSKDGGIAAYAVTIATSGYYTITLNVDAADTSTNSYWISFDGDPAETDISDITSFTTGFENRTANIRGTGTFDAPEFVPNEWFLSAGTHTLVFRGRERECDLDHWTIVLDAAQQTSTSANRGQSVRAIVAQ